MKDLITLFKSIVSSPGVRAIPIRLEKSIQQFFSDFMMCPCMPMRGCCCCC